MISVFFCVCIYTYVQNPVDPGAHLHPAQQDQATAGSGKNYTTQAPLCIVILVASGERLLLVLVRIPQGTVCWKKHLAVNRVFPHMCMPVCCCLSSQTLLLCCKAIVKEHNKSLSASVVPQSLVVPRQLPPQSQTLWLKHTRCTESALYKLSALKPNTSTPSLHCKSTFGATFQSAPLHK